MRKDIEDTALLADAAWLHRLAGRLVDRDGATADDLVQDAYLAALEAGPSARPRQRGWWATVLRRLQANRRRGDYRRDQRQRRVARPEATDGVATVVARAELHAGVVEAVLALDEPYRTVLLARYFDDRSAAEIAASQGTPAATVRSQLARGVEQLRARLDARFGDRSTWSTGLAALAATHRVARGPGGIALAASAVVAVAAALIAIGLATGSLGRADRADPRGVAALDGAADRRPDAGASPAPNAIANDDAADDEDPPTRRPASTPAPPAGPDASGAPGVAGPAADGRPSAAPASSTAPADAAAGPREATGPRADPGGTVLLGTDRLRVPDPVQAIAVSPSGAELAAVSVLSRRVVRWRMPAGEPLPPLSADEAEPDPELEESLFDEDIWELSFDRTGARLAAGGSRGTVWIWSLETGELARRLEGPSSTAVRNVTFRRGADGANEALVGYANATLARFDLETGRLVELVHEGSWSPFDAAAAPDGAAWAAQDRDEGVLVIGETGPLEPLRLPVEGMLSFLDWSGDGAFVVAAGGERATLHVWERASGSHSARPAAPPFAFEPGTRRFAYHRAEGSGLTIAHLPRGEPVRELACGEARVLAFGPDDRIYVGEATGTIRVFDLRDGSELLAATNHRGNIAHLEVSPRGDRIATAADDVRLWTPDGVLVRVLEDARGPLAWSADGASLLTTDPDRLRVLRWDLGELAADPDAEPAVSPRHAEAISAVSVAPDGSTWATASIDARIRIWRGTDLVHERSAYGPDRDELDGFWVEMDAVSDLAFSADGRLLAAGTHASTLRTWDVATGDPGATHRADSSREAICNNQRASVVRRVAFGGPWLAFLGSAYDEKAWVVAPATGRTRVLAAGQQQDGLALTADGSRLVTGGGGELHVWDPRTGELLETIGLDRAAGRGIRHVAIDPAGRWVAVASDATWAAVVPLR